MVRASGRAVVFSTVTLAVGFWVGIFSSFVPTVHFSVLTGAAFLLGLVSQFVVLPLALIFAQPLGRPARLATRQLGALLGLTAFAATLFVGTPVLAEEAPRQVLLKDQYGKADGPARHRGQTILLLYGKVEGLRRMKAWEEQIREKVPGALRVLRGLDARGARGQKTEAEVDERLQQSVPSSIAILIDWNGDFVRAYDLPDANVSATVLDPNGNACRTMAGSVTPGALEQIGQVLKHVREAGTCP